MTNCPLCSAPVTYQGLVNVECKGIGCPNFKSLASEFWGNEPVSWDWLKKFAQWFSDRTGEAWTPEVLIDSRFQLRRVDAAGNGSSLWILRFAPNVTRDRVKQDLSVPQFSNGLLNPYCVYFI